MSCPILEDIKQRCPELYKNIKAESNKHVAYKVDSINGTTVDSPTFFVPKVNEAVIRFIGETPSWLVETLNTNNFMKKCQEKSELFKLAIKVR